MKFRSICGDLFPDTFFLVAILIASLAATECLHAQTSPATLPDLRLSTAGRVIAIVAQSDGKLIIGGSFLSVNGVGRTNLARLNPNGSVDLTWTPPAIETLNEFVTALAIDGTDLFVGGQFGRMGGVTVNGLAKISLADFGTLNPNWLPMNAPASVFALAVSGSQLYVGGEFGSIGGTARTNLARLDTTGSGSADPAWNPNPNGAVSVLLLRDTNVFVGGSFTNIGGVNRTLVAKLSASGTGQADSAWNAGISASNLIAASVGALTADQTNLFLGGNYTVLLRKCALSNGQRDAAWNPFISGSGVSALFVTNGSVYVGGPFYAGGSGYNGLVKLSSVGTGAPDPQWRQDNPVSEAAINGVNAMLVTPAGIYVGGSIRLFDGTVSLGIAKADLIAGKRDGQFGAQVQIPGLAYALAQQPDGKVIVGGDFWFANGLPRNNLARLNQDGTLDSTWAPKADGQVRALAINGTNLYVAGNFAEVNGLSRSKLAKIGIHAQDEVDAQWSPGPISGGDGFLYALAVSGTNLFVGGCFDTIGGEYRWSLAKVSATGNGALDTNWTAYINNGYGGCVYSLVLNGTDLFVGGSFDNIGGVARLGLAKVSTTTPAVVDLSFQADGGAVYALALDGTNLFVGGGFSQIGGQNRRGLAKASTITGQVSAQWNPMTNLSTRVDAQALSFAFVDQNTNMIVGGYFFGSGALVAAPRHLARVSVSSGLVDYSFNRGLDAPVQALLPKGRGVYASVLWFSESVGAERVGVGYFPVVGTPRLVQANLSNLFITRNPADGNEVSHFRVTDLSGVELFLNDGFTPVTTNDFVTVEQGAAGLRLAGTNGAVTVVSAVNATPGGAGTAATTLNLNLTPLPTFMLGAATYSAKENTLLTVTVRKLGSGSGSVSYTTADGNAASGGDYQPRSGALSFTSAETQKNLPTIAIANDFTFSGDRVFFVRLTNSSAGTAIGGPALAMVTIIDDDGVAATDSFLTNAPSVPLAPPISSGVLKVSLQPTDAGGQWRLLGEINWHDGGATVSGLVTGNYGIEFRPVNGYRQPGTQTLPITAGQTNAFAFFYAATAAVETGGLTVAIQPPDVATNLNPALRGQWRRQGEGSWHDGDEVLSNLNSGSYTVEYKSVTNHLTPAPQIIQVGGNANYGVVATYLIGSSSPGALTPAVVPFASATTNAPYRYNGQIQTSVGFGSGAVVKQRVVLTAAHVLFDDVLLSYTTYTRWFFQRYRDQLEPEPQVARGWYFLGGYSAQRQLDKSPGISTSDSQTLDAAALYFLEAAGRGGYGGYLASEATDNEFLLSANNKFLAGYPLDVVLDADKGKLFATIPTNLVFSKAHDQVYATTQIASYPGNSGGPLYVQNEDGVYYPAGICLVGSGQLLVRAINSEVVDLINRAEISANGGGNIVGGGVTLLSPGITAAPFGTGLLNVRLTPSYAVSIRPGWRVAGNPNDTTYITEFFSTAALIGGGGYPIEFKPVPGFLTPTSRTVQIAIGQSASIQADYLPIPVQLQLNSLSGLSFSGGMGARYRMEFSTNLVPPVTWTPLTTFTLPNTSFVFSNTRPTNFGRRFYRSVLVP